MNTPALDRSRVVIEHVSPEIDGGRFPVKRTAGQPLIVEADVFADGHSLLAGVLRYRFIPGATGDVWEETPLRFLDNDRWTAQFTPWQIGTYAYTLEAWIDAFESWREGLEKWLEADQVSEGELLEGAALISAASARAKTRRAGADARWLAEQAAALAAAGPVNARAQSALAGRLRELMSRYPDRTNASRYDRVLEVLVDRERARFGAWYEMFPRSDSPEPGRSATFKEAESRLPAIAGLGFDVLYLPPVHPIGTTARKGPNNSETSAPGDPGSPWAIGSRDGGHKAIEPGLGTLDDFDRFVKAAAGHGLEIALDIAFQCSPDHPYVTGHPEWFRKRPDGSIKYAENPPKKYQDIYPIDFETPDWEALWHELRSVVLFWIEHGVRIFRVDNPHTKPFRFWEWLIRSVRGPFPDTVFLAEAFTRPKVMKHLAKLGFTQSYTYFTWRNEKEELEDYFMELTRTEMAEYFRPNLFANTPDILHAFLQTGGRPGFQVRAVLAATLGATYGIYSGFELCEHRAVAPGSEEYLDSEKYQYRRRDWDAPGNIADLIRRLNTIRRATPALQYDTTLDFTPTDNARILAYTKTIEGRGVLVIVNLDPRHVQQGWVTVPLATLALPGGQPYDVDDLLDGERYRWEGARAYVRFDPAERVAHVLAPAGR